MNRQLKIYFFIVTLATTFSTYGQEEPYWVKHERLDKYVNETPNHIKRDAQAIVKYLKKAANTDRGRVELIYYWIARNIVYDVKGYVDGSYANNPNDDILESKKGVCQDYAVLFKTFCDYAKIECVVISGYAKGHGYSGQKYEKPNHAWNAVRVNKQWKLIDVTWGSGYVAEEDDSLVFKRNLNLGYLFSKPEGFIIEHFPEEPKWQLLKPAISREKFYSKEMDKKIKHIFKYL